MKMKIFLSIFAVSITLFFFFSLSLAYSWIFYLSATIHKDYMFLFCNGLLVFICLNSHLSASSVKGKQAAPYYEGGPTEFSRTVGEVGNEKQMGSFHVVQVREDWVLDAGNDDEKAGETLSVRGEETYDEEAAAGDDKILLVNVQETRDDAFERIEDDKIVQAVEETKGDELEVVEDDTTLSVMEETQDDELEMVEDDKTLSVIEETHDDQHEQGGSIDAISLEELNRKCEEFIRRMKKDIRVESLTIQCH